METEPAIIEREYENNEPPELVKCDCCDTEFAEEDGYAVGDDFIVCDSCHRNRQYECAECGIEVFDVPWNCSSNAFRDEHAELTLESSGASYCQSCYDEYTAYCDCCDERFPYSYLEDGRCESCNDNNDCCGDFIRGYHSQNKAHSMFPAPGLPWYMGIELEIEYRDTGAGRNLNDDAGEIHAMFDTDAVFFEEDGSISSGFEIISAPMTYEYHKDEAPWADTLSMLRRYGYRSHNGGHCGIHVHVSRSAFDEESLSNVVWIVENHWDEIVVLSRRNEMNWSRPLNRKDKTSIKEWVDSPSYHKDRYQAVNCCPTNTVEFRFFRGTLKELSFFAAIDIINALVVSSQMPHEQLSEFTCLRDMFDANNVLTDTIKEYMEYRGMNSEAVEIDNDSIDGDE